MAAELWAKYDVRRWRDDGDHVRERRIFYGGLDVTDRCAEMRPGLIDGIVVLAVLDEDGDAILKETFYGPVEVTEPNHLSRSIGES